MAEEDQLPEEYEVCSHCGDPLEWFDMFGIAWCSEMYNGVKKEEL